MHMYTLALLLCALYVYRGDVCFVDCGLISCAQVTNAEHQQIMYVCHAVA
jgi:hypothetical protein